MLRAEGRSRSDARPARRSRNRPRAGLAPAGAGGERSGAAAAPVGRRGADRPRTRRRPGGIARRTSGAGRAAGPTSPEAAARRRRRAPSASPIWWCRPGRATRTIPAGAASRSAGSRSPGSASPCRCGIAIRAAWRRPPRRSRARPRRRRRASWRSASRFEDGVAATTPPRRSPLRAYGSVVVPKATAAYEMSLARYREMALAYPLVLTAQRALLEASDAEIDAVGRRRPGGGAAAGLPAGRGGDVKLLRLVWHGLAVIGVLALAGGVWLARQGVSARPTPGAVETSGLARRPALPDPGRRPAPGPARRRARPRRASRASSTGPTTARAATATTAPGRRRWARGCIRSRRTCASRPPSR